MDGLKSVRKHANMSFTFAAVLSQKTVFFKGVLLRKNFSNLTEKQKAENLPNLHLAMQEKRSSSASSPMKAMIRRS